MVGIGGIGCFLVFKGVKHTTQKRKIPVFLKKRKGASVYDSILSANRSSIALIESPVYSACRILLYNQKHHNRNLRI